MPVPHLTGILNLNKPVGITSRDAVNVVQKLVRPVKVGHAGTLDPLAEGVLLVCLGSATRLVPYLQQQPKTYVAGFRLGMTSTTDDITGELTPCAVPPTISDAVLDAGLQKFLGKILQVPPQVSAVHVKGQRAYKLARQGATFELSAKPVEVFRLQRLSRSEQDFEVEIDCSSGTYIRAIGRDLGEMLGCGCVMTRLTRTAIGSFRRDDTQSIEQLSRESLVHQLSPSLTAVAHFPRRQLTAAEISAIRCGQTVPLAPAIQADNTVSEWALVDDDTQLIAIASSTPDGLRLQPQIVFSGQVG